MGLFLSIALVHKPVAKTKKAILEYSGVKQGDLEDIPDESIEKENILYAKLKSLKGQNSVVLFPSYNDLYDCSRFLSGNQDTRVLAAHVYDGDVWLVYLFYKGNEITSHLSNPGLIEEKPEDWLLNKDLLASHYEVSSHTIEEAIKANKPGSGYCDVSRELFAFLEALRYPADSIQDFDAGYKSLISSKELKRITKLFLTVDDLRKTKRYSPKLITLDTDDLKELFDNQIEFVTSHQVCPDCGINTADNKYFLSIDSLCFQVYGRCISCDDRKPKILLNYGFIDRMEQVRDFLNK